MKQMFADFMQRYRNAKKAIAQIRAGEWQPEFNPFNKSHMTANRGDLELWIANGPFWCEISRRMGVSTAPYFGIFWRHYVWWAAVRKFRRDADRSVVKPVQVPVL